MKVVIAVSCHKKYKFFPNDEIYVPIEVGACLRNEHFLNIRDDNGYNISSKNASYCELTALYYAWKNMDYDYLGLCHYRRYLSSKNTGFFNSLKNILKNDSIVKILENDDFILPKKTKLRMTIYEHSKNVYDDHHMDVTGEIIKEYFPTYYESFTEVMNSKEGHFFNIFIGKKEIVDKYLNFLFTVLQKVEERYNFSCINEFPESERVFGYIAESMIDVFIKANDLSYKEKAVIYLESGNIFKRIFNKIIKLFRRRK